MKEYASEKIRNVAFVGHSSAGKTILCEALLNFTGATTRMGRVEDGTTVSDFDDEEVKRGISLYTSVIPIEYNDFKINLLDTPGYTDFIGEVISALCVADSAVVLLDAVSGKEVGTEIAWNYCDQFNLPRFVLVNKMDRDNANFQKSIDSMQGLSDIRLITMQLPWGEKQDFQGVIDILSRKAYKGDGKDVVDIPDEYKDSVESAYQELVEAAAEGDDALLEKYLENGELSEEEVITGLKSAVQSGVFAPVLVSAGSNSVGITPLLDAIVNLLPSPVEKTPVISQGKDGDEELKASDADPLAAYVWKTTADPFVGKQTFFRVYSGMMESDSRIWNQTLGVEERMGSIQIPRGKDTSAVKIVHAGDIGTVPKLSETSTGNTLCDKTHPITLPVPEYPNALFQVAVFPKTQADSTKISPTLTRLCEEDMTLSWHNEPSTRQTILQGMGDQHIEVAIQRAEKKFQVNLLTETPKVPYQETINGKGDAMYRHKKQSGGSGQFGEVHLRVEPYPDGDFDFKNSIFGGAISSSYLPAIEKGIKNVMKEGVIVGYPIKNVRVDIYDGKEHPVDSKPIAFEIAGREAFKLAFKQATPVLLEPIMKVEVIVPEANMGDVLGDMNSRRARVQGMDTDKGKSTVTAHVPLAEMMRYTTQLRSITGGRGIFNMEYSHYEVVPAHLTQEIIDKTKIDKKEE